jgi:hypothetical protein
MTVDLAEITRILDREQHSEPITLVEPGSVPSQSVPDAWRPIATSEDPETRRLTTLALWNREFLYLVPQFAHALRTELADVRVGHLQGEAVLVYAFEHVDAGERFVQCWIGWDPATFDDAEPPFYDCIPEPLQKFYRQVHAGFTAPDRRSFGPMRPKYLVTLATREGWPDGIPDWGEDIPSTRLLLVAATYSEVNCCVSPDLPRGQALAVYRGVADPPTEFGALLDTTMQAQFLEPE